MRAQTRAQRRAAAHGRAGRIPGRYIAIAVAVAVVVFAGLIWFTQAGSAPAASTAPVAQSSYVRGDANAPVTIDEWADFQCPACGSFARTTEQQLLTSYIAQGKVKLVFHNYAFLGMESVWAASAAECAADQGKFWEFHDKLYASQIGENRGTFSKDNLKRFGADLGLGTAFAPCVDSDRYAQRVSDERKSGDALGVRATPTLFVGGQKIEGAASLDQLRAIIDPLLVGR